MEYVIRNNKDVYIKLAQGSPVPCAKKDRGTFNKQKAENILEHLPKSIKRMHFHVECVPDVKINSVLENVVKEVKEISNDNYEVSDDVTRWVEKFGACGRILSEAKDRYYELQVLLRNSDEELMDILHEIELINPVDLYRGWIFYRRIKVNRKKRQDLKDEMLIIHNVIDKVDATKVSKEQTQRAIDGLFGRKYTYRVVEDD